MQQILEFVHHMGTASLQINAFAVLDIMEACVKLMTAMEFHSQAIQLAQDMENVIL
jgi:hypothetical protein